MTVASATRRNDYVGNGVTTTFPVTFQFFEIEVYTDSVLQVEAVDYDITQDAPGETGSVVFRVGSIPASSKLIAIVGATVIEQSNEYEENSAFPADVQEKALDRLTMISQELLDKFAQTLSTPASDPALDPVSFFNNPNTIFYSDEDGVPGFVDILDVPFISDAFATVQAACAAAQVGAEAAELLASYWAIKTDGIVDATDYSSKAWAIGGTGVTNTASRGAAKEWAVKTGGTVDGTDYSAKKHATDSAASASAAASSASGASTSATNAASSATSASSSAAAASGSASAAAASQTAAASSASAASTSATNASNSASSASTSASTATTQASNASTSASAAATSASGASTSASTATTQASNASTSASAAATSASAAAASYDSFDDRYLGAYAADPTLDNDGNALLTGAIYFKTGTSKMRVYNGSAWNDIAPTTTVDSVFGRTGTIAAATGDYTLEQIYNNALEPGGRLSLSTGVPVMSATVSGATTVYYTPYQHRFIPIWDGARFRMRDCGGELSQATSDTTKSPAAVASERVYDLFVWDDSGTMRCTRGPAWTYAATVTMTIATPCVVTWTAHGLSEGMPVVFTTSGALPTGITAGTVYYVGRSPATNTFNVSTTRANAAAGTFVATSGTQSGTHTGTNNDTVRGTGAGTTELERKEGVLTNKNAITNGPAANKGTYVGSVKANSSSTIDWIFGGSDIAGWFGVWNMYNRSDVKSFCLSSSTNWTYTSATVRASNGSTLHRHSYLMGVAEDSATANFFQRISTAAGVSGATNTVGIGQNSTTAQAKLAGIRNPIGGANSPFDTVACTHIVNNQLGFNYMQAVEASDGTNANLYNSNVTEMGFTIALRM